MGTTLRACGRRGHGQIVEHCLDTATHFAEVIRRTRNKDVEELANVVVELNRVS